METVKYRYIFIPGYVLWFFVSFFGALGAIALSGWVARKSTAVGVIILFLISIFVVIKIHKILASLLLWVNLQDPYFNTISTGYAIIGLIGIVSSIIYYDFDIHELANNGALSFAVFLVFFWLLFSAFVLFPKSMGKRR